MRKKEEKVDMMRKKERELLVAQFVEVYNQLSQDYQEVILWVVKHYESLEEFINIFDIQEGYLDEKIKEAKADNKALLHILLVIKKTTLNDRL